MAFRPRKSGESLGDYLKVKQAYELETTGKTGITLPAEKTAPPTASLDNIRTDVLAEVATYADKPEGYREKLIETLVKKYGKDSRSMIVDTIYKELRGPGEPAYVAPAGTTYAEEKEEEITIPTWLEDNDYFQQLPPDEQEYLVQYYNVLMTQDEENQKILAQALEEAKAQADPYFAEKIRMAQDELTRALGRQAGDFGSLKRDLELRIDQITEDLATGKERLSIDQQAELARRQRTYENVLDNLIETARHRGLTFSTKRALAESQLQTEQADIVESTKREFQRKIFDLQQRATRGEVEAQNLLEDYERTYGESVTSLIRTAEKQLGTEQLPGLPDLPGVSPLGGVIGSFAEEKQIDILQRAEALANLRNPFL